MTWDWQSGDSCWSWVMGSCGFIVLVSALGMCLKCPLKQILRWWAGWGLDHHFSSSLGLSCIRHRIPGCGKTRDNTGQRLANYSPGGQLWLAAHFWGVNKVLLEHSHVCLFYSVSGCFGPGTAKGSKWGGRPCTLESLRYLPSHALQKGGSEDPQSRSTAIHL